MTALDPADQTVPSKIVRFHADLDSTHGGIVSAMLSTSSALARAGAAVTLLTLNADGLRSVDSALNVAVLSPEWITRVAEVREHLVDADWVVIDGPWSTTAAVIAVACWRWGVPYSYVPHGALSSLVRALYPLKHAKKLAYWLVVERLIVRHAECIWYASALEATASRRTFPGMPDREAVLGFSSRDLGQTDPARIMPRSDGPVRLVTMARINPIKRIDLIIRALAILRADSDVELIVVGDGQHAERSRLERLAVDLGVAGAITWTGHLDTEAQIDVLASADIYVCAGPESFGMSVAEGLSAGLPVVITSHAGLAPAIQAVGAGVCVPPGSPSAIAGAVQELCAANEFASLASASRTLFERELSEATFPARARAAGVFRPGSDAVSRFRPRPRGRHTSGA